MDGNDAPGDASGSAQPPLPPFPDALMLRYRLATGKLTKFQRTLFK